jgi:hypothetical protein
MLPTGRARREFGASFSNERRVRTLLIKRATAGGNKCVRGERGDLVD